MTSPKTPRCNDFFGTRSEILNPVEKFARTIEAELTDANLALSRRCNCRFTQGGFHTATCDFHERLQKRLAEAEDKLKFLSQKRP